MEIYLTSPVNTYVILPILEILNPNLMTMKPTQKPNQKRNQVQNNQQSVFQRGIRLILGAIYYNLNPLMFSLVNDAAIGRRRVVITTVAKTSF